MLIVHDANILIDMHHGGILPQVFQLAHQVITPDVLFHRELRDQHANLLELGLELYEVHPEGVVRAIQLAEQHIKTSTMDLMALALAEQENCPLLTGDKRLRNAAEGEGVVVHGTIWLVEQLVTAGLITKNQAASAYEQMEQADSRLPFKTALKRLKALD